MTWSESNMSRIDVSGRSESQGDFECRHIAIHDASVPIATASTAAAAAAVGVSHPKIY